MKKYFLLLLVAGLGFFAPKAQAAWSAAELAYLQSFRLGMDDNGFSDPYQFSLWGSIQARKNALDSVDQHAFALSGQFEKPLTTLVYVQEPKWWKDQKSKDDQLIELKALRKKLVVIFPGIYNAATDSQSKRAYSVFKAMGYHVLVAPNPWSVDFIHSKAKSPPGDIENEAETMLKLIQAAQNYIGKKNIISTELVSYSYGAFLAAVTRAKDNLTQPLIDGESTLFGPPIQFAKTIEALDHLMDQNLDEALKIPIWTKGDLVQNYLFANTQSQLNSNSVTYAEPFLTEDGFHASLLETAYAANETYKLEQVPHFRNSAEKAEWEKNFRFQKYFRDFTPNMQTLLHSEKSNLVYWLRLSLKDKKKIRVVSAADDFLNTEIDEETVNEIANLPEGTFYLLPRGGHLGYQALPWFKNFEALVWK